MPAESHVSIIVCAPPMVCATAMLNANAVPPTAEAEVHAAAQRLAIFLHHVNTLPLELDIARKDFHVHLQRNWDGYVAAAKTRTDLEYIAFADGLGYLARLHAILYEFKAFLDLFGRLLCRLVSSQPGPPGFNKGKVAGRDISGGRLINWLSGHSLDCLPNRDALIHGLSTASHEWITGAVEIRNTLGHFRDLPGFRHMRISVSRGPAKISPADILLPEMPDGRDLITYAMQLRSQLCQLASDTLPLVPGVKCELNEKWDTAMRYLQE
jgi:hypothetical protein